LGPNLKTKVLRTPSDLTMHRMLGQFLKAIHHGHPLIRCRWIFNLDKHNCLNTINMLGTKSWARLRPSPNLPTYLSNTSESCLDSYSYNSYTTPHPAPISWPRSVTATALPYIPDEHRTSHSTNTLRRTSFSNLNARGSHDEHQRTSVDYPLSRPPFSFSIDESTLKYHDAYMHFDDDQRGYNRLQRKRLPASGSIGSTMSSDPPVIYDGHQNYSHSQSPNHLPYSS